jgi:hypothetical protein
MVLDLAISLAMGGDCLADIAQLRAHPQVFGAVVSDPTVSRCIDALAADPPAALAAISAASGIARAAAWALAGEQAPDHDASASAPLVIDVDATLVTAQSEKECAAPTFKRGFGFHPAVGVCRPRDRGARGTPAAEPPEMGVATQDCRLQDLLYAIGVFALMPGMRPGSVTSVART